MPQVATVIGENSLLTLSFVGSLLACVWSVALLLNRFVSRNELQQTIERFERDLSAIDLKLDGLILQLLDSKK